MSWVEPIGYVRLLKGVALEPGYENTIYFESKLDQFNYFFHHNGISFNSISYTRYNRGIIRVGRNIKDCYNINYMMYCNDVPASSSFSSSQKWFYCFVTEVNYIAEEVTEIIFEPDVLQSWMFDYDLGSCYVDRQHTVTDAPGEWIEEEGLDVGPKMYQLLQPPLWNTGNWSVVVACDMTPSYSVYDGWTLAQNDGGGVSGGVYSALHYVAFDLISITSGGTVTVDQAELTKLREFFSELTSMFTDYTNRVVSVFMMPTAIVTHVATYNEPYTHNFYIEKQVPTANHPNNHRWLYQSANGQRYVKNYKLYTYPYTALVATNGVDTLSEWPFEFFGGSQPDNCLFRTYAALSAEPECWMLPLYYRGLAENFNEKIDFGTFPVCSWSSDNYFAWLANTMVGFGDMVLNDVAAGARYQLSQVNSARIANRTNRNRLKFSGSPWGNSQIKNLARTAQGNFDRKESNAIQTLGLVDYASEIAGNLGEFFSVMGDTYFPFNPKQANMLRMFTDLRSYQFFSYKPTDNYIERLDDYFSRYGYAIKKMWVPNRKARTRWTYLKTVGLNFTRCDMPGDIAEEIRSIYEAGVTWWYANFTINQTTGVLTDNNSPGTYESADNGFWGTRWQAPAGGV